MSDPEELAVGSAIIQLMRGVVYRESEEDSWLTLQRHGSAVQDHFATIGVQVVVDDNEGYAYLRSHDAGDGEPELPRLIRRRALSYNVSLLLVLLRKHLVQHENDGGEGQLVVSRDQIVDSMRVFLPDTNNDAKTVDAIDSTIRKAVELGFLRQLRAQANHWEVRRILKAYVDAQTLGDFAAKLEEYAATAPGAGDE